MSTDHQPERGLCPQGVSDCPCVVERVYPLRSGRTVSVRRLRDGAELTIDGVTFRLTKQEAAAVGRTLYGFGV